MRIKGLTPFLVNLGVAALYIVCAKLGLALAIRAQQVTAVWPPTGFALAAVLRLGERRCLPGILLGAFVANATAAEPLWVAAGIATGNTLEALIGATVLRHFAFDRGLARVQDVIALAGAVAVSPLVAATIGAMSLVAGRVQPASAFPALWWLWWLGDALGGLIVAPLFLVWSWEHRLPPRRGAALELSALLATLIGASAVIFMVLSQVTATEYVIFPILIWTALRFGPAETATVAVAANAIAVWGTHLDRGPFAGAGPEHGLVLLQVFMAVAATTALLLGAVTAENRQADRRKDEFLAMLGHELRNPLAPIVHAVELLDRRESTMGGRARQIIRRQSEHLNRLVDDLLDVSRITHGTVRLEREHVTVAEPVAAAIETWRHLITQRRQQLSVDMPQTPIWLDVDPTRFTQIVANLLHNASKFTPEEGRIAVSARVEGDRMVLRVSDSGEGMSPEVLSRAFELFVQGPPPLDRPKGGLGLGLTLVRRLVELHGGTIEARSEGVGRGSEFIVRFPVSKEEQPSAEIGRPQPAEPAAPRSRRILVVEDNADAREAMTLLLQEEGHDVHAAADGFRALDEVRHFTPEVVLLDLGLPGLDGYAVARELRARPETAGALIVAITGYGQADDRALTREAGFDYHLLKPVEPRRLIDLLRL